MKLDVFPAALILAVTLGGCAGGATIYGDRASFQGQLGHSFTDNYENPAYHYLQTAAQMTAVYNQTRYIDTAWTDANVVFTWNGLLQQNHFYCDGCNGSLLLDFTSTSYGGANGVFGAGFDIFENGDVFTNGVRNELADAFVTFGDGSTEDFTLPAVTMGGSSQFFAVSDSRGIKSIYIGYDGQAENSTDFVMDNLTIGTQAAVPTPEPASVILLGAGLAVVGVLRKRLRH